MKLGLVFVKVRGPQCWARFVGAQGKMFCGWMVFKIGGMEDPTGEMNSRGTTNSAQTQFPQTYPGRIGLQIFGLVNFVSLGPRGRTRRVEGRE